MRWDERQNINENELKTDEIITIMILSSQQKKKNLKSWDRERKIFHTDFKILLLAWSVAATLMVLLYSFFYDEYIDYVYL